MQEYYRGQYEQSTSTDKKAKKWVVASVVCGVVTVVTVITLSVVIQAVVYGVIFGTQHDKTCNSKREQTLFTYDSVIASLLFCGFIPTAP